MMCYYRDPNGAESNNKHLDEETPYWDSYDSINQLYLELGKDTFLLQSLQPPFYSTSLFCKFFVEEYYAILEPTFIVWRVLIYFSLKIMFGAPWLCFCIYYLSYINY